MARRSVRRAELGQERAGGRRRSSCAAAGTGAGTASRSSLPPQLFRCCVATTSSAGSHDPSSTSRSPRPRRSGWPRRRAIRCSSSFRCRSEPASCVEPTVRSRQARRRRGRGPAARGAGGWRPGARAPIGPRPRRFRRFVRRRRSRSAPRTGSQTAGGPRARQMPAASTVAPSWTGTATSRAGGFAIAFSMTRMKHPAPVTRLWTVGTCTPEVPAS